MDEGRFGDWLARSAVDLSRRTVARGALSGGLLATLLASSRHSDARAQATPAVASDRADGAGPRRYLLHDGETGIVYMPATTAGAAQLDYRDATGLRSFTGDDLETSRVEPFGLVATVLLGVVHDGYTLYLTLLVPEVNQDEGQPESPIQTLAILTTQRTSIGGPALVRGALQTYEGVSLEGVAEFGPL